MKIDVYTKAVLTIIAASLVWSSVQGILSPKSVAAAGGPQKVILVDAQGNVISMLPVDVKGFSVLGTGPTAANPGFGLPVVINNGVPLPVVLTSR